MSAKEWLKQFWLPVLLLAILLARVLHDGGVL